MICCWNSIEFFYHHYMTPLLPIHIFHSPLNGIWLNKVYSGAKLKSMQLIQYGWWFLCLFLNPNRTFNWNNLLKKSALVLSLDSVLEPYNIDNKEKFLFSDTCKEDPLTSKGLCLFFCTWLWVGSASCCTQGLCALFGISQLRMWGL